MKINHPLPPRDNGTKKVTTADGTAIKTTDGGTRILTTTTSPTVNPMAPKPSPTSY
jgi:hypothetical protein